MNRGRVLMLGILLLPVLLAASPAEAAKKDTLVVGFSDVFSTLDHVWGT